MREWLLIGGQTTASMAGSGARHVTSMRIVILIVRRSLILQSAGIAALLVLVSGCIRNSPSVDSSVSAPSVARTTSAAEATPSRGVTNRGTSVFERPIARVTVDFKVHRFSAPKGAFTGDDWLRRMVSEPLPDAAEAMNLSDNGFWAGVGVESDREPLLQALQRIDGLRSVFDQVTPDASRAVQIRLGHCAPRETVFCYDESGSLQGLEILDATLVFRLRYAMRSTDLTSVSLELTPVIEEPPGPLRWVMTEDGPMQQSEERNHAFTDLGFAASVSGGGFLLLGPTTAAHEHPLVGRIFFTEKSTTEDGTILYRENIYIISPIVQTVLPGDGVVGATGGAQ